MIILTTTYNCENYVERSIFSIMSQRYKNFTCYITDDVSTDNTVNLLKNIIKEDPRFILIENKIKKYQPGNYDFIIRNKQSDDEEICIEVDGDDWLPNSGVFDRINEIYQDRNVWMTTGSFVYPNGSPGLSLPPESYDNIRSQTFSLSHLRTWKSWLWKKIKEEDLKDDNGEYWKVAGDCAFMFPMFEMSGKEHYRYLPETNYVYNDRNPLNDHKVSFQQTVDIARKIRSKNSYSKL